MFRDEKSLNAIASQFSLCVLSDAFVDHDGIAFAQFASVREYIRALCNLPPNQRGEKTAYPAGHADFSDLSQTLAQLADKSVQMETGDAVRVGSLLRSIFCEVGVQYFADLMARNAQVGTQELWAEAGASNLAQWLRWVHEEGRLAAYADALYELLIAVKGDVPLLDFFVSSAQLGNFAGWTDPEYFVDSPALHTSSAYVGKNCVALRVSKPRRSPMQELAELNSIVLGCAWEATLSTPAGAEAFVSGVIYVFERINGVPDNIRAQLLLAAGAVSDDSIKYVQVMLDQHQDADELILNGDLCFIHKWERKPGSKKGLGAQCLQVALTELRTEFPHLSNAVVDVRPSQFLSWEDVVEPPQVAVAKQNAIEAVTGYLAGIDLQRWSVRHTFSNVRWDQMSAILAIGKQTIRDGMMSLSEAVERDAAHDEERENEGGVGKSALVFEGHEEELCELFDKVGLGDLVMRIDDGTAIDGEIELALKDLFFGQRIHFLQLTVSSGFGEELLTNEYDDVTEELAERIDDFAGALPPEVEISRVFSYSMHLDRSEMVADCVIEVKAETPFGTLYEFFTLVPRPRLFNVAWWVEGNYMP